MNKLGQIEQVVPLLAPIDATTTEKKVFINAGLAQRVTFLLYFGVVTATSADQNITVTVMACTSAATTSGTAIAFNYRVSAATGTDTWGAVTAATSSGISVDTTAADGMMYLIDVQPAALVGYGGSTEADAKYVCLDVIPDAGATVTNVCIVGLVTPRYAATTMLASC